MEVVKLMDRAAGTIAPKDPVEAYVTAGGKPIVATLKTLWDDFGPRTIQVMTDGAETLARVWAGGLIGWGGFQLYDGLFQHKVLGLHQIRYRVDLLPYDLVWNVAGGAGLVIGLLLLRAHTSPVDR